MSRDWRLDVSIEVVWGVLTRDLAPLRDAAAAPLAQAERERGDA